MSESQIVNLRMNYDKVVFDLRGKETFIKTLSRNLIWLLSNDELPDNLAKSKINFKISTLIDVH